MAADPDLAQAVATLRTLLERTNALRAVLMLDRGEGLEPVVVDCLADGEAEVARGEDAVAWEGPDDAPPLPLPDHIHPFPPLEVDLAGEEPSVQAPMGMLDHVARAVKESGALFPERSVLMVGFESTEPEAPVYLAARQGEPLVLSVGEAEYEMPPEWPGEPGLGGPLQL
jgi:hypothetical protein